MKNKVNVYCCFIPISIYVAYSFSIQFLYGVPFMAKSLLLSVIPSAIYLLCFWRLLRCKKDIGLKITLSCSLTLAILLVFLVGFVGNDTESALISGVAVYSLIAFIFAGTVLRPVMYKDNTLLKDGDTGKHYVFRRGRLHAIAESEAQCLSLAGMAINTFSSSQTSVSENSIGSNCISSSSNETIINELIVNPSSGVPMVGGISGLDVHGNSWGTNFNEPSNTYDPNRGY